MRFAYVAGRLPVRAELAPGPIDVEWLIGQPAEAVVFLDEDGPGAEAARRVGLPVHLSPMRSVDLPTEGRVSADHAQAVIMAEEHRRRPFDYVLYASDQTTDYSWFVPELADLPRGVALGEGTVAHLRHLLDDPAWAGRWARAAWATAGFVAGADFAVGWGDLPEYGFRPAPAPPVVTLDGPVSTSPPPEQAPQLLVVVATGEEPSGLVELLGAVEARVPIDAETTVVVIVPDRPVGGGQTADLVGLGCPEHLRLATIVVPPGEDGVAASFLASADLIVAARAVDASLGAVRDRAATTPVVVLEALDHVDPPPLVSPQVLGGLGERRLVPADGSPTETLGLLEQVDDGEFLILHQQAAAAEATRLLVAPRLPGVDLVVLGRPHPVTGAALLDEVSPGLLAVRRSHLPALARRLERATSLWEVIVWCLGLSMVERSRLTVLPGLRTREYRRLPSPDVPGVAPWLPARGLLPRPNLVEIHAGHGSTGPVDPPAPAPVPGIREWAKSHRWSDRVRLALPWRFGLLARAMKDRW